MFSEVYLVTELIQSSGGRSGGDLRVRCVKRTKLLKGAAANLDEQIKMAEVLNIIIPPANLSKCCGSNFMENALGLRYFKQGSKKEKF